MFEVGDRVVCVDASDRPGTYGTDNGIPFPLFRGRVYTIAGFAKCGCWRPGGVNLVLVEMPNYWLGSDIGFDPRRFRKLRDISQSLRELKELAINCPVGEPVSGRKREGAST